MNYSVEQIQEPRETFGAYRYRILRDGKEIAVFRHDHRGETIGIRILNRKEAPSPFAMCSDFLSGGGPQPLELSDKAIEYLDSQL